MAVVGRPSPRELLRLGAFAVGTRETARHARPRGGQAIRHLGVRSANGPHNRAGRAARAGGRCLPAPVTDRFAKGDSVMSRSRVRSVLALGVIATLAVASTAAAHLGAADSGKAQFKLGVVLPTSSHDLNWSQTMTVEVRQVAKQMGAKLSLTDNVFDPTKAKPIFERLATQHYDLILAHSFSYIQLIKELAPKYPSTPFVLAGGLPAKNVIGVTYSY